MGLRDLLMRRYVRGKVNDVQEGKMGDSARKVYWYLAGKKTVTGVLLRFAAAGLRGVGRPADAGLVEQVGDFLMLVGLADKVVRQTTLAPERP